VFVRVGEEKLKNLPVASVAHQVKSWETGALFEFEGTQYKVLCGPGDEAEPVITIMMPWED
jgi:hypothetical protein